MVEYKKAKAIEDTTYTCSICDEEPEYCFKCEEGLIEDEDFYCDGFGVHLHKECYKKN